MKGKVLNSSNHHYIWVFLKQKIKSALVSKEVIENLIAGCTVLLLALLMMLGRYILFSFKQLSQGSS